MPGSTGCQPVLFGSLPKSLSVAPNFSCCETQSVAGKLSTTAGQRPALPRNGNSILAFQEIIRECMKRFGFAIAKDRQCIVGISRESPGFGARFIQANYSRVGRFLCRDIFAGAFSQDL